MGTRRYNEMGRGDTTGFVEVYGELIYQSCVGGLKWKCSENPITYRRRFWYGLRIHSRQYG